MVDALALGASPRKRIGVRVPSLAPALISKIVVYMHIIYVLSSIKTPGKLYIGYTVDVDQRVLDHNAGKSICTAKFRPWNLVWHCIFEDKAKAIVFEQYLKSTSGKALLTKHIL